MPHLIIEYSDSLKERTNISQLLDKLHNEMVESGVFAKSNVNSRAYACRDWRVGEQDNRLNFVHVTLWLLDGRSQDQKRALSQHLLEILEQNVVSPVSLSVDVQELNRHWYLKNS